MHKYLIEIADNREKYLGLRDLWCRIFGDEPEFVDAFYREFDGDFSLLPYDSSMTASERAIEPHGMQDPDKNDDSLIRGYVIRNEEGRVVSALTCYRCGYLYDPGIHCKDIGTPYYPDSSEGMPVYVSYAVCTDPEYRGLGLGQKLTAYVRDVVAKDLGGISLVSPAEPSLIEYYRSLGYREGFFVDESSVSAEDSDDGSDNYEKCEPMDIKNIDGITSYSNICNEAGNSDVSIWGLDEDGIPGFLDEDVSAGGFVPEFRMEPVDAASYNRYRESFLEETTHVSMNDEMISCVRMCSIGSDGLVLINGGDAICALSYSEQGTAIDELIVNPVLTAVSEEITEEIALRIAEHLGTAGLSYRTPGAGRCQAMYAAPQEEEILGYFGFPIE